MVKLTKNKKAVFFTFTAILMMAVFLLSFFVYSEYRMKNRALVIETRVTSMDDFIQDIKVDIERGLYISSFRSILSMTEYITRTYNNSNNNISYNYLNNTNTAFQEVFFNGTINGQKMNLITNNTFPIWEERVKQQAAKTDIQINFYNETANISQDNPWKIKVTLKFILSVGDLKSTSYWLKNMSIETYVNIINFEDPIYRIGTHGLILNAIRQNNITNFVTNNDTIKLQNHTNESYYIHWTGAPSFLKRLQGDLSADPQGIESLVNIPTLEAQKLTSKNKTIVDYIYFNTSTDPPDSWEINQMPPSWTWFRLDNQSNKENNQTHLQIYEVAGLTKS